VRFEDGSELSPAAVIWATGFALDHSFVQAPVFAEDGCAAHRRGVTAVPGLYFLGLLWQHSQASASLLAPELDGPYLLERMGQGRRAAAVTIVS
jgi:putative flavoprotein involved in K+ transport